MQQYDVTKYEKNDLITAYETKIKSLIEETDKNYTEMRKEANDDMDDIDSTDLVKEQNKNMKLYQKYINKYAELKLTFAKVKQKHTTMEAELYDYYRFNWDKSTKLTETAISKYVASHRCFIQLSAYVELLKNIIDFIEKNIEGYKNRNYAIKNIIEVRKIELGMN